MKYTPLTKPFPHQKQGMQWFYKNGGRGGFFWIPGTGKTKVAVDIASSLHQAGKAFRVLVLCPINALGVWPEQIARHSPVVYSVWEPTGSIAQKAQTIRDWTRLTSGDETLTYLILNYDAVTIRDRAWEIGKALEVYDADLVILDECHKIKNATTKRTKAVHKLTSVARYRMGLTGTPIGRNLMDLYSQLKAIEPETWRREDGKLMSWTDYRNAYGVWGGSSGYQLIRYQNVHNLEARYKPRVNSVASKQGLGLPDETDVRVPVVMPAPARAVYEAMSEDSMVVYRNHLIEAPIPLTKLLRLHQMAGGWVHDENGELVEIHRAKLDTCVDLVGELQSSGQKVLVFAKYKRELAELGANLQTDLRISGGVSDKQRRGMVDAFIRAKKPVAMVIQVDSAEALDGLQRGCSYAIYYSKAHGLIGYQQSRGRIARTGQQEPVTFYHLEVVGSVDLLITRSLNEKRNLEKWVMDHPEILSMPVV